MIFSYHFLPISMLEEPEINLIFAIPVANSDPLSFVKLLYRDIVNWLNVLMQAIQEVQLYKREELSGSVLLFFEQT